MKTYEKPVVEVVTFQTKESVMDVPKTSDGVEEWSVD